MKITFNIGTAWAEEHTFAFGPTTFFLGSIVSGISFWIMAAVMLFDPSYQ